MTSLRIAPSAAGARILGLGAHRPSALVSNDDLVARGLETSDEWIRERTGIQTRHIADPDEHVVDMAVAAGEKALAHAGLTAADLDAVLVATCSHPYQTPGAAAEVAYRLGARAPGAADVGAACAGFCYTLALAADAIRGGSARHVLVVGADKFTDIIDPADRGVAIIFGDGAGAAVVGPSDAPEIGPVAWGSDGSGADLIAQRPSWPEARADPTGPWPAVRMDGPAVFRWTVTQLIPVARRACELAGVDPADLAAFVPHQANLRIVDSLSRALGAGNAVIARDVVDAGNTSAASVPLALSRLLERGEVRRGDPALLFAFGSGLTYAGQVVLVP